MGLHDVISIAGVTHAPPSPASVAHAPPFVYLSASCAPPSVYLSAPHAPRHAPTFGGPRHAPTVLRSSRHPRPVSGGHGRRRHGRGRQRRAALPAISALRQPHHLRRPASAPIAPDAIAAAAATAAIAATAAHDPDLRHLGRRHPLPAHRNPARALAPCDAARRRLHARRRARLGVLGRVDEVHRARQERLDRVLFVQNTH